ncbi:MAG: NADH:flavin oxidoreductase/NADH oxidase [Eubacteriales bacterium]|nr:NADH:flavin oxidoreductase/NADH oxidase [Eubacteriales bacterium]MDD3866435.1 NADH:flavin oxidoreductase/NADH oxidase [Eubacteriales bacterium]MDD4461643.1 NADH:flavin oxidoreductase/NADH oxidase [Eubacteriales bacterium]
MLAAEPVKIGQLELKNRLMMSPMCMFCSDQTGLALPFHQTHYGSRAIGGIGLIMVEATGVTPAGRITHEDLGLWNDRQADSLRPIVAQIHASGSKAAIQLAHAGRKCEDEAMTPVAPSALAFSEDYRLPQELSPNEIGEIVNAFAAAAKRAAEAGFDAVEIHGAHGYLIHQFLSPLSNQRTDAYGGSPDNRLRLLREVLSAVRAVFPEERPVLLRLSASDYLPGGLDLTRTIEIVQQVCDLVDAFDISSGGLLQAPIKAFPGYQVSFAETIRQEAGVLTIAVGQIRTREQVEDILGNGRADLIAIGRELLRNPYWYLQQYQKELSAAGQIPQPYTGGF